jgi:CheW-like domain
MRDTSLDKGEEIQDQSDALSLCSFYAGGEWFGIDTKEICEVLGERELQSVPLAPSFIAGVVSYRGEVLTTVDLRALLEAGEREGRSNVLVLEDEQTAERFGCWWMRLARGCGEQGHAGGESIDTRGSRQMVVRWSLQDARGVDGAACTAEVVPVAAGGDGSVSPEIQRRVRCEH